jgi:hypothetical protein
MKNSRSPKVNFTSPKFLQLIILESKKVPIFSKNHPNASNIKWYSVVDDGLRARYSRL